MQSLAEVMKQSIGAIKQVGSRTCEICGKTVPIMMRGEQRISDCLNCETIKLTTEMVGVKNKRDADKTKRIFNKYSHVPAEMKKATLDNFVAISPEEAYALKVSQRYIEKFDGLEKNTLVFAGSVGTGKTHLAYSIAKKLQANGKSVIFITLPDLLMSIRDTYSNKKMSEFDLIQVYKKVDLLVLDDIGAEYIKHNPDGSSWVGDIVFNIVNARTDSPTIFTTNLDSEAIKKHYGGITGERIVSRMKKNASNVLLAGEDKRGSAW